MASYAIKMPNGKNYLTAVNGGGMGTDADIPIRTDAEEVGRSELFTLFLRDLGGNRFGLRTMAGYYVTFVNGGGIGGPNSNESPLHTDATKVGAWERFTLRNITGKSYSIQTPNDENYLTSVDGWGEAANKYPIHTDARRSSTWEIVTLVRLG